MCSSVPPGARGTALTLYIDTLGEAGIPRRRDQRRHRSFKRAGDLMVLLHRRAPKVRFGGASSSEGWSRGYL